jgi:hypothetical protein
MADSLHSDNMSGTSLKRRTRDIYDTFQKIEIFPLRKTALHSKKIHIEPIRSNELLHTMSSCGLSVIWKSPWIEEFISGR